MRRFALLVLTGAVAFNAACSRSREVSADNNAKAQPAQVATVPVVARTVPAAFAVTGSFVAEESSDVAPLIAGRVAATPVNVGDFVKHGQVLVELDHRDAQLRVDQARAQWNEATHGYQQAQARIGLSSGAQFDAAHVPEVAAARANYESALANARLATAEAKRYENLVKTGDVSKSTYDKFRTQQETAEAQANAVKQQYEAARNGARQGYGAVEGARATLDAARAMLAQAEKALADTTIRAPFDGYVSARPVAVGEYVATSNKLATVVRIGTLKLQLQTPEQRAARVKLGMKVVARVAAFGEREFEGKVTAINPSVDPSTRIFVVEARFANPKNELRPGMFANAQVQLEGGENALFVDRRAVLRDRTTDSNQVFVVENSTARLRVVVTGAAQGNEVRIESGLNAGDAVALTKPNELYDGAPVRVR